MKKITFTLLLTLCSIFTFADDADIGNNTADNVRVVVYYRTIGDLTCPMVVTRTVCMAPFSKAYLYETLDPALIGLEPYMIRAYTSPSPCTMWDATEDSHSANPFVFFSCGPPVSADVYTFNWGVVFGTPNYYSIVIN